MTLMLSSHPTRRKAENTLTSEDEIYLTYTAFGRAESWWGAMNQQSPDTAAEMLKARVWEGDNLKTYMAQQEQAEVENMSKSRKKQYLRYMKSQKKKGE